MTFTGCISENATLAGFIVPNSPSLETALMSQLSKLNFTAINFDSHDDYEKYINAPNYWADSGDSLAPLCFVIEQTTDVF